MLNNASTTYEFTSYGYSLSISLVLRVAIFYTQAVTHYKIALL